MLKTALLDLDELRKELREMNGKLSSNSYASKISQFQVNKVVVNNEILCLNLDVQVLLQKSAGDSPE